MVCFSCGGCGDSFKKVQAENHFLYKCRGARLSCLDCGTEFLGDKFKKHTTCVSEAEKYSGGNFKPKASAQKGLNKQQEWNEIMLESASEIGLDHPKIAEAIASLSKICISRKLQSFQNTLRQIALLSHVFGDGSKLFEVADHKWKILNEPPKSTNVAKTANGKAKTEKDTGLIEAAGSDKNSDSIPAENGHRKKHKKERHSDRNAEEQVAIQDEASEPKSTPKKSKKEKKRRNSEANQETTLHDTVEVIADTFKEEKKRKRKLAKLESSQPEVPDEVVAKIDRKKKRHRKAEVLGESTNGLNREAVIEDVIDDKLSHGKNADVKEKRKKRRKDGEAINSQLLGSESPEVSFVEVVSKKSKRSKRGSERDGDVAVAADENGEIVTNVSAEAQLFDRVDGDRRAKKDKKRKRSEDASGSDDVVESKISRKKDGVKYKGQETTNGDEISAKSEKFNIESVVKGLLKRADDNQLSLKKLNKKVYAEYQCVAGHSKLMSKEKLEAKLLKKVSKNSALKYLKDKVTLVPNDK